MKNKNLLAILLMAASVMPLEGFAQVSSIRSGVAWTATDGTNVNAHGGGMIYEDGFYYWFGESRKGMKSNGVSVYRSKDLYNWENLGLALKLGGERKNTLQDIAEGRLVERPKVIRNEKTGKYVMWGHWEDGEDYSKARVVVATSDKIEGPYQFVRTLRPNGQESRDQTVFVDDDGQAYHIRSSEDNMTVQCTLLNDDYTKPTNTYKRIIPGKQYEAPAIMKIADTYIGFFSGCTGWDPNPGHVLMSNDIMSDNWRDLGNPCTDDGAGTTYTSQSTFVLKVQGYEDAYMFMADRWNKSNVETSTYVWLPVFLRTGYPMLRWYDSWDLSVFERMARYKRAAELKAGNTYMLLARISDRMVSLDGDNICLMDDDESKNLQFVFEQGGGDDVFRLCDAVSGKYLTASGNKLKLIDDNGSAAQEWVMEKQGDKFYLVKNRQTGQAISVEGASTKNHANIVLAKAVANTQSKFGLFFDADRFDYVEDNPFYGIRKETGLKDANVEQFADMKAYAEDGRVVVCGSSHKLSNAYLVLYDMAGNVVASDKVVNTDGKMTLCLPSGTQPGVYILNVNGADNVLSRSFKILLK